MLCTSVNEVKKSIIHFEDYVLVEVSVSNLLDFHAISCADRFYSDEIFFRN